MLAHGPIARDVTVNLIALRRLKTGGNIAPLQRYILGLALVAATEPLDGFLRQGCLLVPDVEVPSPWLEVARSGDSAPRSRSTMRRRAGSRPRRRPGSVSARTGPSSSRLAWPSPTSPTTRRRRRRRSPGRPRRSREARRGSSTGPFHLATRPLPRHGVRRARVAAVAGPRVPGARRERGAGQGHPRRGRARPGLAGEARATADRRTAIPSRGRGRAVGAKQQISMPRVAIQRGSASCA